jgi:hypothetical protein
MRWGNKTVSESFDKDQYRILPERVNYGWKRGEASLEFLRQALIGNKKSMKGEFHYGRFSTNR